MKTLKTRLEEIKNKTLKLKGGDFIPWYKSLSPIEVFLYKMGFNELQKNNETHR